MIRLSGMTSVFPDMTLDEGIAALVRHGYQGIEPRVEWNHRSGIEATLSAAERREVRAKVQGAGLEVSCIATSVRAAEGDPDARRKHMDDLATYIDLAADLGCRYVRTFGGQRPRDRELKYIVDYVVEAYRGVMSRAADRGVVVLMETHDDWSHSSEVMAVVEQVDSPNLKVLWDLMHPQRMFEKPEETFNVIGSQTRHVHAHYGDYPAEGPYITMVDPGSGVIDHATPLSLLNAAGFDGYYSVEVIHRPGSEHDPDRVLRLYAEDFARINV